MSETRPDPERIYLEPAPGSPEGRMWCEDDVWIDGDEPGGVEYVRADLHDAEIDRLRRIIVADGLDPDAPIPPGLATELARLTRELEAARERERARGDDLTEALGHLSALVDMLHHDGHIERCGDHAASLVSAAEIYLESPSLEQEVGAATAEIADCRCAPAAPWRSDGATCPDWPGCGNPDWRPATPEEASE